MKNEMQLYKLGFYISSATAIVTLVTFTIAFMTPPLSGPLCAGNCFEYPYTDVASRFPRDYIWMYPAMLVMVLYIALFCCIHLDPRNEQKAFTQIGYSFALMATIILIVNYFVQITVIQPSLLNGETDGIGLLSQYNPHGIFIALEEIGFLFITISFLLLVPAFRPSSGLFKTLRVTWILAFILAIVTLAFISFQFGIKREYYFEIAIISIAWLELIITSILMSRIFYLGLSRVANGNI